MDKKKLMPQAAQPVNRISTGHMPAELAELSEEALQLHADADSASVGAAFLLSAGMAGMCSYDGDDAE